MEIIKQIKTHLQHDGELDEVIYALENNDYYHDIVFDDLIRPKYLATLIQMLKQRKVDFQITTYCNGNDPYSYLKIVCNGVK